MWHPGDATAAILGAYEAEEGIIKAEGRSGWMAMGKEDESTALYSPATVSM